MKTLNETVLVVAAHPDDEVLGCGGTIAAHADAGDVVHILIAAEGATSRGPDADGVAKLRESAASAGVVLGASSVTLMGLPDNRLDSMDLLDLVQLIEGHVNRLQPTTVYTHHAGDVNVDHRRLHEAVATACRPTPASSVRTLLAFEVPSSTEWQPRGSAPAFVGDWYVDISATLNRKMAALRAYESEMRSSPHPRSYEAVEHLARWRGATVGTDAAEAFVCLRHIEWIGERS